MREEPDEQRAHAGDAEEREHAAGDEDGREACLPREAPTQDDAEGEVGVGAHAWRKHKGEVGQDAHQPAAAEGSQGCSAHQLLLGFAQHSTKLKLRLLA